MLLDSEPERPERPASEHSSRAVRTRPIGTDQSRLLKTLRCKVTGTQKRQLRPRPALGEVTLLQAAKTTIEDPASSPRRSGKVDDGGFPDDSGRASTPANRHPSDPYSPSNAIQDGSAHATDCPAQLAANLATGTAMVRCRRARRGHPTITSPDTKHPAHPTSVPRPARSQATQGISP
jgi:hypothetical protein